MLFRGQHQDDTGYHILTEHQKKIIGDESQARNNNANMNRWTHQTNDANMISMIKTRESIHRFSIPVKQLVWSQLSAIQQTTQQKLRFHM